MEDLILNESEARPTGVPITVYLSEEQAAILTEEYGSTDYCQTYLGMLVDHLLLKKAADTRSRKIAELSALPSADLDTLIAASAVAKEE